MVSLMKVHGTPQYYVESVEELDNVPENAPAGTVAIINTEDGVYKYNPLDNTLTVVLLGDYRAKTGTQAYVAKAAVNFVTVGDLNKKTTYDRNVKKLAIYSDTGHCTMGFSLFTAANNMKGVDRAMVDIDALFELLGLSKEDYLFSLSFSLGY